MRTLDFPNATAVATRLDVLGGIYNDFLGKGLLSFSGTQVSFADVVLPYRDVETPTLKVDHLLFRTFLSVTVIVDRTQYTFHFRGTAADLKGLPIPFDVVEDRHLFVNGIVGLFALQVTIGILTLVSKWLSS